MDACESIEERLAHTVAGYLAAEDFSPVGRMQVEPGTVSILYRKPHHLSAGAIRRVVERHIARARADFAAQGMETNHVRAYHFPQPGGAIKTTFHHEARRV